MTGVHSTVEEALAALERERVENVRLRRRLSDLLYNLDEENMPAVIARIEKSEAALAAENEKLALLFKTDEAGKTTLSGEALARALGEEGVELLLAALTVTDGSHTLSALPGGLSAEYIDRQSSSRVYEYGTTLSPAKLEMKQQDGGSASGGDLLSLSPHGMCIPYLRRKAGAATSGLYPLFIDKDGNIIATYP